MITTDRLEETGDSMLGSPPVLTLWTVGHSNRSWDEFHRMLAANRIDRLVDVRHFPTSRHVPWANGPGLAASLAAEGVEYVHLVDLGGYRKARPGSANLAWRSSGFRGYADHMDTAAFRAALDSLLALATLRRTAVMCAEALPWRCHRSLLSDALLARRVRVMHILGPGKTQEHRFTTFARVRGDTVEYPAQPRKRLKQREG